MNFLSIAMGWTQSNILEENPAWQLIKLKRRPIMGIRKKFWILVSIYLIYLLAVWMLIIIIMSKLL